MDKTSVMKFCKKIGDSVVKHSPEILTGIGIAGMFGAGMLAVKETPKALKLLEEKKKVEQKEELTTKEVVKTTWKCYAPAVATGVLGAACVIGAGSVSARRSAALATAYKISETALAEYREKVIETIGEKKEEAIRDLVAKEKVDKNPVSKNEVIVTEKGNTLCYDSISGRYFKSDKDKIDKAVNTVNKRMLHNTYISLNEFYDELGLPHNKLGDDLGWNVDRDSLLEIYFTSHVADDGTPCLVMEYEVAPKYGYYKLV